MPDDVCPRCFQFEREVWGVHETLPCETPKGRVFQVVRYRCPMHDCGWIWTTRDMRAANQQSYRASR
jgi:hypothetical protein